MKYARPKQLTLMEKWDLMSEEPGGGIRFLGGGNEKIDWNNVSGFSDEDILRILGPEDYQDYLARKRKQHK